jgi:hypothetical protein
MSPGEARRASLSLPLFFEQVQAPNTHSQHAAHCPPDGRPHDRADGQPNPPANRVAVRIPHGPPDPVAVARPDSSAYGGEWASQEPRVNGGS